MNVKTGLLAVVLLLAPAFAQAAFLDCLHFDGFDGEGAAAPAAWKGNLRMHNCARRTALPTPVPALPLLRWSGSIAQTAQAYANRCTWGHSGASGLGENLYASAPPSASQDAAIASWLSEFPYYDYAGNSCASGQQCGHYTQIVWRGTQELGCGIANCSTGSPFGASFPNWTIVVCNYSPPGNYNGQRPY